MKSTSSRGDEEKTRRHGTSGIIYPQEKQRPRESRLPSLAYHNGRIGRRKSRKHLPKRKEIYVDHSQNDFVVRGGKQVRENEYKKIRKRLGPPKDIKRRAIMRLIMLW